MTALNTAAAPLYEKVKTYILSNIEDGTWQSEDRIPSENEIVAMFQVSRMTVNRALRELSAAGVLNRIAGVGTFVAPIKAQTGILEVNNIAAEILQRGHRHHSEVVSLRRVRATSEMKHAFEDKSLTTLFHSVIVHFENGRRVQVEERHVNPVIVPLYDRQDFTRVTAYDYLGGVTPATELEH